MKNINNNKVSLEDEKIDELLKCTANYKKSYDELLATMKPSELMLELNNAQVKIVLIQQEILKRMR